MDRENKSDKFTMISLFTLIGTIVVAVLCLAILFFVEGSAFAVVMFGLVIVILITQIVSIITGIIGFTKKRTLLSVIMFGISMISVLEMGGFIIILMTSGQ